MQHRGRVQLRRSNGIAVRLLYCGERGPTQDASATKEWEIHVNVYHAQCGSVNQHMVEILVMQNRQGEACSRAK